ncbi:hypothetical protein GUJ93_ZPchr0013g35565 [Zizania palustris]|uniref:Uncharacterized protein n=1 Tax=Zizania palustris TaxID=103762 RepID=A0A8J5WVR0_ZIZPA|nr:hypothetical protein GUJ93_ZPchr0013g35565 [Zizania palustris]
MGTVATCQVTHGNILTTTHKSIPSNGGEVVLLRDGGFEWPVGGAMGSRTLSTRTPGEGSRGNNLATNDNINGGFGYDTSTLGGGSPDERSPCVLGQEGPDDGSTSHGYLVEIAMRSTSVAGDGSSGRRGGVLDAIGSAGARGVDSRNTYNIGGRAVGGWNAMMEAVSSRA